MSKGKKYILVCIDYVMKWVEEKAVSRATKKVVVDFLFYDIFVRFGVPKEIVTDQGTQFVSNLVKGKNIRSLIGIPLPTIQRPMGRWNRQIRCWTQS